MVRWQGRWEVRHLRLVLAAWRVLFSALAQGHLEVLLGGPYCIVNGRRV